MIPTPAAGTADLLREAAAFNTKVAAAVTKLGRVKDDDVQIATTPKDEIYRTDKVTLYRYRALGEQTVRTPLLIVYSLIGRWSPVRISANKRSACNDCMDCFEVCPEPQVIRPALKGEGKGVGPVILAPNCTNCGRCIDVCSKDVFTYGLRFNNPASTEKSGT